MIVAVNIRKSLNAGRSLIHATERAWALKISKCRLCDFVVAVNGGSPEEYYEILDVFSDTIEPRRVAFKLRKCTPAQRTIIDTIIGGRSLRYIQRGRYFS